MKNKAEKRKELLAGESHLEAYAKQFYIDRFSNVPREGRWESKIEWGIPSKKSL